MEFVFHFLYSDQPVLSWRPWWKSHCNLHHPRFSSSPPPLPLFFDFFCTRTTYSEILIQIWWGKCDEVTLLTWGWLNQYRNQQEEYCFIFKLRTSLTYWKVISKLILIQKMPPTRKRLTMQYEADSIHGERRSFRTKSLKSLVRFNICEGKLYNF